MKTRTLILAAFFAVASTALQAGWKRSAPMLERPLSADELKHPGKDKKAKDPKTGSQPSATAALAAATASSTSPEIANLARGLLNSPERIYEFVKNNIAYEHYYGAKKGALMTLFEGSGNDADQCLLLAELLTAAGYSPSFRQAIQIVPYDDATDNDVVSWLGLDPIAFPGLTWQQAYQAAGYSSDPLTGFTWDDQVKKNYLSAQQFCGNRGWPSGTFGYASNGTALALERIWVSIVRNGITYQLDPSFKKTTRTAPFPVGTAMGYDRAALLTAAGGVAPNRYTISGVNETTLGEKLSDYTTALVAAIRNSSTPHLSVEQLLGRQEISQVDVSALPTAAALPVSGTTYLYSSFPEDMLTVFNLTLSPNQPNEASVQFPMAQLAGKRLSLTFVGDTAQVWLDDDLLVSTSVPGPAVVLGTGVGYPYGLVDTSVAIYRKSDNFAYALAYAFSPNGTHVRTRERVLADAIWAARALNGVTYDTSGNLIYSSISDPVLRRRCITETLNVIGLSWFYHTQLSERIVGDLNKTDARSKHRIGRAGQEEGYYVDMYQQYSDHQPLTGVQADSNLVFQLVSYFNSAHEHGVIERMQQSNGATSTMKIMALANRSTSDPDRDETFLVDPASIATVKPLLKGYDSSFLAFLDSEVAAGSTFLLPENSSYTLGSWTGTAYVESSSTQVGMIISGNLNGGYNSSAGNVNDLSNLFKTDPHAFDISGTELKDATAATIELMKKLALEPVDMSSGAFVHDHEDISLGEAEPRGLHLVRSYNSHRRDDNPVGLGWGWTHNYDMRAVVRSAPEIGLGESTPADVAASLVAAYAALDIYTSGSTAKEWAVTALIAEWGVDNLKNNAVAFNLGAESMQFIKQPDGAFQAPGKSTLNLMKDPSGDYILKARLGSSYRFAAAENLRIKTITDIDGKTMTFTYNAGKLASVVDAVGRSLTFNYTGGRLTSVTDNCSPARTVSYGSNDADGNLTSVVDPENKTTGFVYTDRRITETRDADNQVVVQNFYGTDGRVERQRNQGLPEREWKLYWSSYRNVEENPQGQQTSYFFDRRGRSLGTMNGKGERDRVVYDGVDHIVELRTPKDEITRFSYDKNHNLVQITDPLLAVTTNTYDSLDRLTQVDVIDPTYPDSSNPTAIDRSQRRVYNEGNSKNRPDKVFDARNVETRFTYEPENSAAAGKLTSVTQASTEGDRVTLLSYDSRGLPLYIDTPNPDGGTFRQTFSYSFRGDLETYIDKRGQTFVSSFSARREKISAGGPGDGADYQSTTSKWKYDNNGRLQYVVDPLGRTTRRAYTPSGKLLSLQVGLVESGSGSFDSTSAIAAISNTYDNREWLTALTGPLDGQVTQFSYDAAGRPVTVIDAEARTVTNAYDADGHQNSTSDKVDALTARSVQNAYNARGYQTSFTDPDGVQISWSETTAVTNRRNQTFRFAFEANGLPKSQITPLGKEQLLSYNDRNLLYTVRQPSGSTTTLAYDSADRVRSFTDPVGTVQFTYDQNGNTLTASEGATTISRTYDPYGRVKTYTDGRGNQLGYSYYSNGLLKTLTYPGNRAVTYAYDALNRLQSVQDWAARVTTFEWRADGLLAKIVRPNLSTRELFYDRVGQLLKIEERNPLGVLTTLFAYQHDLAGRISSRFELPRPQPANIASATMVFDEDNRLTTYGGTACVNDENGNLTYGPMPNGVFGSFNYDARNRLTSVGGVSYGYDSENIRVSITQGTQTTFNVIDPHSGSLPSVLIRDKGDGTKIHYIYGAGILLYQDTIPTGGGAETVIYYHYDNVGNTVALTNDVGAVTDRLEYGPYGAINYRFGNTDTPFLFGGAFGAQTDANGLCYLRARYFNPRIRRFVNADPIGFAGGLNWYASFNNNPISYTDPSGLWAGIDDAVAIGVGAVVGLAAQGAADLWHGRLSPGSHYLAAAAGGAVAGEATLYAGPAGLGLGTATAAAIGGATGGLTTNVLTQTADISAGRQNSFSPGSAALATGLGAGGGVVGATVLPAALSTLSNAAKGDIGQAMSLITNVAKGNVPAGLAGSGWQFETQIAGRAPVWDWRFVNIFTGEIGIVESKFGTAGLTSAQRAVAPYLANLSVEYWTYEFWAKLGAAGGYGAGAATAAGIK